MIKLYQYAPAFGLPNASPFCFKLEAWLHMTGLPFEIQPYDMMQMSKAPKGKMPFIEDQGQIVADSSVIIDHLTQRYGVTLDDWLQPEQKAVALAFQRLMEDHMYWTGVHNRWMTPTGWQTTRNVFFAKMPALLKLFVPALVKRSIRQQLRGHGMGRHSHAQIVAFGQQDIAAIAHFLGSKPYMMGDQPCSLDAVAYAFIANQVAPGVPQSELTQTARSYPQLVAYCERMRERYFVYFS
jgi:glutathione S-transferase